MFFPRHLIWNWHRRTLIHKQINQNTSNLKIKKKKKEKRARERELLVLNLWLRRTFWGWKATKRHRRNPRRSARREKQSRIHFYPLTLTTNPDPEFGSCLGRGKIEKPRNRAECRSGKKIAFCRENVRGEPREGKRGRK